MTPDRLQQLIDGFASRRIAVIGDFFLDKYLDTDPALGEPSLETGRTANQVVAIRRSAGAAGTVVNNLAALGVGTLHAVGAIGEDGEAFDLRRCLDRMGCTTDRLLPFASLMTPTYLKPRDVTTSGLDGEHERYDTKNRRPTPDEIVQAVLESFDTVLSNVDAVIIADQVEDDDCGIITAKMRQSIAERARRHSGVIFWADSRKHIRMFRNVIIKPNQFETVGHENPGREDQIDLQALKDALPSLRRENGAPVCATLAERGMLVSDPQTVLVSGVHVDGPLDPTGAGDSATAAAVAALAVGATLPEAALVGNLVASITVQQLATTGTASTEQLFERLELWRSQNEA